MKSGSDRIFTKPESSEIMPTLETMLVHTEFLIGYARQRLGDHQEAEEAAQDCLLAAWRGRQDFAGRSELRTWLVGILRHKVLDRLRARGRRPDRTPTSAAREPDDLKEVDARFTESGAWRIDPTFAMDTLRDCPRESTQRTELREMLRQCIGTLPETQRRLFTLRELDQFETGEAAALVGITAASAAVLLSRARFHLRDCMQRRLTLK